MDSKYFEQLEQIVSDKKDSGKEAGADLAKLALSQNKYLQKIEEAVQKGDTKSAKLLLSKSKNLEDSIEEYDPDISDQDDNKKDESRNCGTACLSDSETSRDYSSEEVKDGAKTEPNNTEVHEENSGEEEAEEVDRATQSKQKAEKQKEYTKEKAMNFADELEDGIKASKSISPESKKLIRRYLRNIKNELD